MVTMPNHTDKVKWHVKQGRWEYTAKSSTKCGHPLVGVGWDVEKPAARREALAQLTESYHTHIEKHKCEKR